MNRSPLILASTSKYRARLLARLQLPFSQVAPGVDESGFKNEPARLVAEKLALAKAQAVAARHPDAVVIGSDQVCAFDGTLLDKPGTVANAEAQLRRLAGNTHELFTAVVIQHTGRSSLFVDTTRLRMRALSPEEIATYVDLDQPLDCAGSYKIESLGVTLLTKVESQDATAIEGLPLLWVSKTLRDLGLDPLVR